MEIPKGLCQCGCGQKTVIAKRNDTGQHMVKGEPQRFVKGHHLRPTRRCYKKIKDPDHPRSSTNGYVLEHILLAEKALGKPLPSGAQIHHVNMDMTDNSSGNLVVCQDASYHKLLHVRKNALQSCGHVNWLKCPYCQQYDAPENMYVRPSKINGFHRSCAIQYRQKQ